MSVTGCKTIGTLTSGTRDPEGIIGLIARRVADEGGTHYTIRMREKHGKPFATVIQVLICDTSP